MTLLNSIVYIALGSNLRNPKRQLQAAIEKLQQAPGIELLKISGFYRSKALTLAKTAPQSDYINAAAKLSTSLSAEELLAQLQHIEALQGRLRDEKWAARTLDLDILLYADKQIQTDHLSIPHIHMAERNFVIMPLFEIAGDLQIPGIGSLAKLFYSLSWQGLERLHTRETKNKPKVFISMSKISITTLNNMKQKGEKFTCLTAYDASFAVLQERAGVEVILIGDSLGMVIKGQQSTLSVSMDEMVYHTANVSRASRQALIMADLPFAADVTKQQALTHSARLMAEGGAHMVKIEGGSSRLKTIRFLAQRGIPVCSHLGLLPQSVFKYGGYKIQGRSEESAAQILEDASKLEQAGADMLLLECVPATLAAQVTQQADIPVIGIGAGVDCDAQVLVSYDMLGITQGNIPRFAKNFLQQSGSIEKAFERYVFEVKQGIFPDAEHSYE